MNNEENNENILRRAAVADCLSARISENTAAQQVDLIQWIFRHVSVPPGSRVLELCCGTGAQTIPLIERVGDSGRVVAVDVSRKALDTVDCKVGPERRECLSAIETNLDDLANALLRSGDPRGFNLAFCAYGLYYSKNASQVLDVMKERLSPSGRLVVVGPFGPNNEALFKFLEERGVTISDYVRYTSQDFMWKEVIPWATVNFNTVRIKVLVNPVRWDSAQNVLSYWQNSTFYMAERLAAVQMGLEEHFRGQPEFVNKKWIMLMEACNE